MDAYESTRVVFSRIQSLDPENASKIMGLLLIQDHGEKEMIRLAFGPESLVHTVVLNALKDLGLLPPSNPTTTPSTAVTSQNSSHLLGGLPHPLTITSPSWAPPQSFSRANSMNSRSPVDDLQNPDQLITPSNYGGGDLIDQFQLSFLNDYTAAQIGPKGGDFFYPDMTGECRSPSGNGYSMSWGVNGHHRRSCSAADICFTSEAAASGFGWKPCLYFARGYCKNGTSCRFLHGLPDDSAAASGGGKIDAVLEQQCQELFLRSKSQRLMASAFPFSPTGSFPPSPSSTKCMNFLLQQQNDSQRAGAAAAAAAALMLGGDMGRSRMERTDLGGMVIPGSRQIYLTFPADSTFREEDVSNYFSIYGPVQDVRIPYQQKRMFGFVTFVYPETVKLILAKGNPHFVCDARVLVKPYKEKGKVPDKYRKQQSERGDFSGCTTPNGLDSGDPYEVQQLGSRMPYNGSSNQELLLRRKLEEQQQQAAELQRAIELQGRRFMGLHLLDLKNRRLSSPSAAAAHVNSISNSNSIANISSPAITTAIPSNERSHEESPPEHKNPSPASASSSSEMNSSDGFLHQMIVNVASEDGESTREASPNEDSIFQESAEHNLPDSPFASPTKSSFAGNSAQSHSATAVSPPTSSNHLVASTLLPATSTLDMASFKSCFYQIPRFSTGHGAVGM